LYTMEHNRREINTRGLQSPSLGGGDADNSVLMRRAPDAEQQQPPQPQHPQQQHHHHPVEQQVERPIANSQMVSRPRLRRSGSDRVDIILPCAAGAATSEGAAMAMVAEPLSGSELTDTPAPQPNPLVRFCLRLGLSALLHPYEMAKILIQLGHEPITALPYQLPFVGWRPRFYLPGVQQYVMHIYQLDGFRGLYRGLGPRLVSGAFDYLLGDVILDAIHLTPYTRCVAKSRFGAQEFLWNLMCDTMRLASSVAITHPFYVVMVRQVAQFVGREAVYEGLWSSLKTLLDTDGLAGLYAGVVPLFLGEWAILAGTSVATHLCHRLVPMSFIQQQYNSVIIQMVISKLVYPLHVTAACMAATGAPLSACEPPRMPLYNHWVDCLADLQARGGHHRGGLLFWRTVPKIQMVRHLDTNVPPL
ncbi:hypothetical protein KR059_000192, partial [Drosophila kikkawai]